ncbi:hypothetical protein MRB53_005628 [Persea americana]|uniref:Uncharacterized protein n=1 Tax=Persea americana TaxID=3435 RepID=A0ACC2MEL9_PERAE|nr:hypothetical protein MRB53_005628 [Persea americana]
MMFLQRPSPTDVALSIPSDKESIPCSDLYGEVRWTQSVTSILRNLQHAHPAMMPEVAAPVVDLPVHPQAPPVVPPPAGPVNPFFMSYAQYKAIIHGQ